MLDFWPTRAWVIALATTVYNDWQMPFVVEQDYDYGKVFRCKTCNWRVSDPQEHDKMQCVHIQEEYPSLSEEFLGRD